MITKVNVSVSVTDLIFQLIEDDKMGSVLAELENNYPDSFETLKQAMTEPGEENDLLTTNSSPAEVISKLTEEHSQKSIIDCMFEEFGTSDVSKEGVKLYFDDHDLEDVISDFIDHTRGTEHENSRVFWAKELIYNAWDHVETKLETQELETLVGQLIDNNTNQRDEMIIIIDNSRNMFHFCDERLCGLGNDAWYGYNEGNLHLRVETLLIEAGIAHNVTRLDSHGMDLKVIYNKAK